MNEQLYEITKELKDMGYPLKLIMGNGKWNGDLVFFFNDIDATGQKIGVLPPELSELVKQCGDGIILRRSGSLYEAWNYFDEKNTLEHGTTPEIAVARLWLKLNSLDQ